MTYDNADEIKTLALDNKFKIATIPMKGTHHTEKVELVISKDLGWLRII